MAIYLRRYFSRTPPLLEVSEHVMAIPRNQGVFFENHHFKVICVLQGMTRLRIDGEEVFRLSPGDVMVIPTACRQHYSSIEPDEDSHVHLLLLRFSAPTAEAPEDHSFAYYLSSTFTRIRQLKASSAVALRPLIIRLRQATEIGTTQPWLAEEVAQQIVFETARQMGIYRLEALPPQWAEAERTHLMLCKEPSGSHGELPSTLRRWLGVTLSRYRSILKIEQAKEMMTYRLQPISMLAQKLGFNSASALSRTFRIVTGYYPKEFQQHLQMRNDRPAAASSRRLWLSAEVSIFSDADAPTVTREKGWLLVAIGGVGEIVSGKTRMQVKTANAEILGVAPGETWYLDSPSPEPLKVMAIPVVHLPDAFSAGEKPLRRLRLPRRRELELLRICLKSSEAALHHRLYAESLFRAIIAELSPPSEALPNASPDRSAIAYLLPVDYAKEYLAKHVSQPIRLSEVAWFSGVSEEHLARSFKQQQGVTVMEYLKEIRLHNACSYLRESTETVTEIARRCGFSTAALFCREFRKATKLTPLQYRQAQSGKS